MSKYAELLDRIVELSETYLKLYKDESWSMEERNLFRDFSEELQNLIEDEADV